MTTDDRLREIRERCELCSGTEDYDLSQAQRDRKWLLDRIAAVEREREVANGQLVIRDQHIHDLRAEVDRLQSQWQATNAQYEQTAKALSKAQARVTELEHERAWSQDHHKAVCSYAVERDRYRALLILAYAELQLSEYEPAMDGPRMYVMNEILHAISPDGCVTEGDVTRAAEYLAT